MDIIEHFSTPFSKLELALFIAAAFVLTLLLLYLLYRLLKKSPKGTKERLKELTIGSKESLFTFSSLAQELGKHNELEEILVKIEPYKFNPNAKELPNELKQEIERFINEL